MLTRLISRHFISFNKKIIFIVTTIISVAISSSFLSKNTPFSGDEFYTLDIDKVHKPVPYYLLVSNVINDIGQIKPNHTFYLRLTSVLFTSIGLLLLLLFIPKTKLELFLLTALIITNPFILSISIFFRYYSFYFMSSVLTLIILVLEFERFKLKTKITLGFLGSIGSVYYLFFLNALQFGMAFIVTSLFEYVKNNKLKYGLFGICLIGISIFILNPILIWKLLYMFNITGHAAIDLNSVQIMGFGMSTFIKPFYAMFQMIFGPYIAPTYSILIGGLFLFLSAMFLIILYHIYKNDKKLFFRSLFFIIIPFFIIYYFFQTLALPGATQLEPKHGMLLFPLILYLAVKSHHYLSPVMHAIFIFTIISAQLTGMVKSFDKQSTDWNKIAIQSHVELSEVDNGAILMDGRSNEIYNFYSQDYETPYPVFFTWENMDSLKTKLQNKYKLILLLNDYKSFTSLSLRQNWNAATGSEDRYSRLQDIMNYLNYHYHIKDSYVSYPTFFYVLEKKDQPNKDQSFSVWKHHLKDLQLPFQNESRIQVYSSVLVNPQNSLNVNLSSELILNLENRTSKLLNGDTVGFIQTYEYEYPLIHGENIWDIFSDYYNSSVNESNVFFKWAHTPLISGSIQYYGSFFKHEARIFRINNHDFNGRSKIVNMTENSSIRIWVHNKN